MGIFSKLFGNDEAPRAQSAAPLNTNGGALSADEQAISRYRYMLKTAPPEAIEQAHAEAFGKLTPEQRHLLLQQLSADLPEAERASVGTKDDPQSLARLATRAEVRQPGAMERTFGGMGGRGGMGMGGMMAGSFLSTIAGVVVGSAIAQAFLGDGGSDASADAGATGNEASPDAAAETHADAGGDAGGFDGGDFGDI